MHTAKAMIQRTIADEKGGGGYLCETDHNQNRRFPNAPVENARTRAFRRIAVSVFALAIQRLLLFNKRKAGGNFAAPAVRATHGAMRTNAARGTNHTAARNDTHNEPDRLLQWRDVIQARHRIRAGFDARFAVRVDGKRDHLRSPAAHLVIKAERIASSLHRIKRLQKTKSIKS